MAKTLMQNILGKNYKWWYYIKYNLSVASGGLFGNIYQSFGYFTESIVIFYLWFQNGNSAAVITYLLVGRIYKALSENYFYNSFGDQVLSGKIVPQLLTPQPFIFYLYFQMIGRRFFRNIFETLAYVVSGIVFIYFTHVEILFSWRLLILLAFIPITFSINHFFGVIIGSLAFFFNDSREFSSFAGAYLIFRNTMSGLILPLDKAPAAGFFALTPYAWVLHHQVQIYLGKYDNNQTFLAFLAGTVWCLILYFLAKLVFKLGLKRNESVGL
jgi:ABC-2 type transport system permease protein